MRSSADVQWRAEACDDVVDQNLKQAGIVDHRMTFMERAALRSECRKLTGSSFRRLPRRGCAPRTRSEAAAALRLVDPPPDRCRSTLSQGRPLTVQTGPPGLLTAEGKSVRHRYFESRSPSWTASSNYPSNKRCSSVLTTSCRRCLRVVRNTDRIFAHPDLALSLDRWRRPARRAARNAVQDLVRGNRLAVLQPGHRRRSREDLRPNSRVLRGLPAVCRQR